MPVSWLPLVADYARYEAANAYYRVHDLDKMVAQLRERGITVELDSEVYPNGRFARLSDPEGNPIQLWQPGGTDPG